MNCINNCKNKNKCEGANCEYERPYSVLFWINHKEEAEYFRIETSALTEKEAINYAKMTRKYDKQQQKTNMLIQVLEVNQRDENGYLILK